MVVWWCELVWVGVGDDIMWREEGLGLGWGKLGRCGGVVEYAGAWWGGEVGLLTLRCDSCTADLHQCPTGHTLHPAWLLSAVTLEYVPTSQIMGAADPGGQ